PSNLRSPHPTPPHQPPTRLPHSPIHIRNRPTKKRTGTLAQGCNAWFRTCYRKMLRSSWFDGEGCDDVDNCAIGSQQHKVLQRQRGPLRGLGREGGRGSRGVLRGG